MRSMVLLSGAVALLPAVANAQILFDEDFSVDPTANWTANNGPSDFAADFFFDYSSVGIPAAPNTTDGSTRGMKLQANLTNGIFSGMSASPNGLNLSGDYIVRFDVWSNTVGPFPGGGSGSTNLSTYGVGTAGTDVQWPGGTQDSVWFGATGDGGSSADWRAYSPAAPTSYGEGDPVYSAASRNAPDPYYAGFGNVMPPAAQAMLFPNQIGATQVGSAGMTWHEVEIASMGGVITWTMDGLLLATVDTTDMTLGGGNIFFGHSDINASSSSDPNDAALIFTLVDNIVVVPAPAAASLVCMGGLLLARRRRG